MKRRTRPPIVGGLQLARAWCRAPRRSSASVVSTARDYARWSPTPEVPRGSLGRFFPGGKTHLVTEAIDVALVEFFGDLERALGDAETLPEAISVIVAPWRRLLVDHDFALGCPLAATIFNAAIRRPARTHVSDAFAGWRLPVADAYARFGARQAEAEAHATVLLAALEGAFILARAQQGIEPLDTVERFFASRAPDPRRA